MFSSTLNIVGCGILFLPPSWKLFLLDFRLSFRKSGQGQIRQESAEEGGDDGEDSCDGRARHDVEAAQVTDHDSQQWAESCKDGANAETVHSDKTISFLTLSFYFTQFK